MTVTADENKDSALAGLRVGKRRRLQALSTPNHVFAILAVDHIAAMASVVCPANPDSVSPDELIRIKVELVKSYADLASGVLVDAVLGLRPMIEENALPGDTGLMLGLEDGDYASLDSEPRLFHDWDVARAAKSGATAIKCSFLYDPFADSDAAHAFVSTLVADCDHHGLPLFAEPLAPEALQPNRRSVVVETARRIGALGVDVLKLEFPLGSSSEESEWQDACLEVTDASPRPWTLLSGGEDYETYARQLRVACAAGASGYVVGRSIWGDLVEGGMPFSPKTAAEARRRFRHLADIAEANGVAWTNWSQDAETTPHRKQLEVEVDQT